MARKSRRDPARDAAVENLRQGVRIVDAHPLFAPLLYHARLSYGDEGFPKDGWALVTSNGAIRLHPTRRGEPSEWAYVLAHCLLHLGFCHFEEKEHPWEWNAACDIFVSRFLGDLRFGRPPLEAGSLQGLPARPEESLYREFVHRGVPESLKGLGTAGRANDIVVESLSYWGSHIDWKSALGLGLSQAVRSAVNVAAGVDERLGMPSEKWTLARGARQWFISVYPLLGSLAAAFDLIEDPRLCQGLSVSVAAVDPEAKEIYINPAAGLKAPEMRFVMAHELLHVGLRHGARRHGRDPFLWNVACDYVINGWLVEMGVGEIPEFGALFDPKLQGLSAEAVYDIIVTDIRRCRKLCTLRGIGLGDLLEPRPDWWAAEAGMDLDDFYRRCLSQGLVYHEDQGRGFLPAALVEEIRALDQPPIPWDVELAQWFDEHFPPIEKVRTYARPSRRQSSTPDIPRPRWVPPLGAQEGRTFGVLLDTSGSMERSLLAKALGAIASYSLSRDVGQIRVVFCDAAAYDQGYMPPEDIAGRVKVKGRGGTVLQPGIDLLEKAEDFPKDGPVLVITDGFCDKLRVKREHAFLLPEGHSLPFAPCGKVFRIR